MSAKLRERRWLCVLVALGSLLVFATSADAECAWVLWVRAETWWASTGKHAIEWSPGGMPTASDCYRAIEETVKKQSKPASENETRQVEDKIIYVEKKGSSLSVFTYSCLPDTVDPRGPKGK